MVGYIYLITDTTNNMKYVGQHHYNKEGELDPNYHGSGVIIRNIYKKRPETLKEEYIKTCYSEEEMNSDEQYYIKFFKTLWPNGYNLTEGGDGVLPCEETRRKISESNKGKILSEETRKKMSENHWDCSGENHPMFGKHHSEETKKKNADSHKGKQSPNKGKPMSEEQKRKISESKKNISDETRKKMSESHKGKPAPNKGKPMSEEQKKKISEALKNISDETRKKMSESHKGKPAPNKGKPMSEEQKKKLSKKVLQFTKSGELVREWKSVKECERNGFILSCVIRCCQGKRKSHKGFKWCYV